MKKMYLSPDKKFLGVCAGVADYLNIDPVILRIGVVFLTLATAVFPCIIGYVIIGLVLPQPPADYHQLFNNTGKKLTKGTDKKFAGVCSGIADYLGADATIIRLVLALSILFLGFGLTLYIICMIMMPEKPVQVTNNTNYIP